ncbi:hypothetical protein ANCCEY_07746 [Ancylostoma ceylanicum]|uniref:G-protein coupled receptors family 1 profile domain-containing protein n=1 Tax=Ancylostoma ceylanicum TaxID=53326 RepID=A0A0D6LPL1_9BILA|nr:hypothetical protein ANCCEY_07746 [Ancylostoma ceylanicum]
MAITEILLNVSDFILDQRMGFLIHLSTYYPCILLLSFKFRLCAINSDTPSPRKTTIALMLFYTPAVLYLILFNFTCSTEQDLLIHLRRKMPEMNFTEKCVTGMVNVLAPLEIIIVSYVSLLFVVVFASIVLIRKAIVQRLDSLNAIISTNNKKLQYALLKFGNLKKHLRGTRFRDENELKSAV